MIVGNGDIARVLREVDRSDRTFFASGVSNSRETRSSEFQREASLLLKQDRSLQLIYFSSLCIFYANTAYAHHKKEMEDLVKREFPMYAILRLGTITWGDNPNTIVNYLRNRYKAGQPLEIRDTTRYVIDREEFLHWVGMIPCFNVEMNVTGQPMKVSEIVKKYVLS